MEGGGRSKRANDGDKLEGAWGGTSRHADQHGESRITLKSESHDQESLLLMRTCFQKRVIGPHHSDTESSL
jgi:hypothetical protein